jgi:hypothetical protein
MARFLESVNHVRHPRPFHRQNRNVEPPTKPVVKL